MGWSSNIILSPRKTGGVFRGTRHVTSTSRLSGSRHVKSWPLTAAIRRQVFTFTDSMGIMGSLLDLMMLTPNTQSRSQSFFRRNGEWKMLSLTVGSVNGRSCLWWFDQFIVPSGSLLLKTGSSIHHFRMGLWIDQITTDSEVFSYAHDTSDASLLLRNLTLEIRQGFLSLHEHCVPVSSTFWYWDSLYPRQHPLLPPDLLTFHSPRLHFVTFWPLLPCVVSLSSITLPVCSPVLLECVLCCPGYSVCLVLPSM